MTDNTWIVGRGDGGCYVEQATPQGGEAVFGTEQEALEYAIACDADLRDSIARSIRGLRARLRWVKKATTPEDRK